MTTTDSVRTAYTSQMSRDFHGITRGIATPEQRRGWEADFDRWLAAHEAEVVGSVLARIDALHQPHRVYTEACSGWDAGRGEACDRPHIEYRDGAECHFDGPYREVCQTCTREAPDDGWDGSDEPEPHPCPTRRLTGEIRGEMSHA